MPTKIEWTDQTFNPLVGCTKISAGCACCCSVTAAATPRLQQFPQYEGVADERGNWTGQVNFVPEVLDKIRALKKPQQIFMPSMSDMFHESVKHEWLVQIWKAMQAAPHIDFQILTKRPERMHNFCSWWFRQHTDYLPNVWLGVSVENQKAAEERIPLLLKTPSAIRFLSCEPLLEEVDLSQGHAALDWVIVGGESGRGARPCDVYWINSLVSQCRSGGIPVFVKQLGSNPEGLSYRLKDRKGGDIEEFPQLLRVREFPNPYEIHMASLSNR